MTREQLLRLLDEFNAKGGIVKKAETGDSGSKPGRWQFWFNKEVQNVRRIREARLRKAKDV